MSIHEMKLTDLAGADDQHFDVFICSASYEERCKSVPNAIADHRQVGKRLVCFNQKSSSIVAGNAKYLLGRLGSNAHKVPLSAADHWQSHCDVQTEPERRAMTRNDLVSDWVARFLMPPTEARRCVDELYRDFCAVLAAGGEVQLRGVGTWKTAARKNGRRVVQLRPSGTLVRAANRMPPRSKDAEAWSRQISKEPSARIPVLIAQIFAKWPSREFLQIVGQIAGSDGSGLLRLLEEMVGSGMTYDPDFTDRFLAALGHTSRLRTHFARRRRQKVT